MPRKTKYEHWFPARAYECAMAGATDEEIAAVLGVGLTTFYGYQKRYPKFRQAIKDGKVLPDLEVVGGLHKSATGHSVTESKIVGSGENERVVDVTKYFPPNPTSAIFWLKNRRPELWRDRQEHDHRVAAVVVPVSSTSGIIREIAGGSASGSLPEPVSE